MIFYFSGTGNSLYAAQYMAGAINEPLISIAAELNAGRALEYSLSEKEKIGFVYPVYAWRAPSMVVDFVRRMNLKNYRNHYIFSICTCGDEEGYTTPLFNKTLARRGLKLNSGFSLVMPNNYIISFNLDPEELKLKKLSRAETRLAAISAAVAEERNDLFELARGSSPFLKSYPVNFLFEKYALDPHKFYATDECTACGLCAEVCNTNNITVIDRPSWGDNCSKCLACIHRCPSEAIQYAGKTASKGRYLNPNCRFTGRQG